MKHPTRYRVPEVDPDAVYTMTYSRFDPESPENFAEKCASDFFRWHGGDEITGWPLIFELLAEGNQVVATLDVDLRVEPLFYATPRRS